MRYMQLALIGALAGCVPAVEGRPPVTDTPVEDGPPVKRMDGPARPPAVNDAGAPSADASGPADLAPGPDLGTTSSDSRATDAQLVDAAPVVQRAFDLDVLHEVVIEVAAKDLPAL